MLAMLTAYWKLKIDICLCAMKNIYLYICVFNTPKKNNNQTTLLFSWLLGNTGWSDVSGAAELAKTLVTPFNCRRAQHLPPNSTRW